MADLLLAPYLALNAPVTVGPWDVVPFRQLQGKPDESDAETHESVPEALRNRVLRLVEAYQLERGSVALGAVIVPKDGQVGDPN